MRSFDYLTKDIPIVKCLFPASDYCYLNSVLLDFGSWDWEQEQAHVCHNCMCALNTHSPETGIGGGGDSS